MGKDLFRSYYYYYSPLGLLKIRGTRKEITALNYVEEGGEIEDEEAVCETPQILTDCARELDEYFMGMRRDFTVNILLKGTDFQKKVWKTLQKIPYGQTASYQEVAVEAGSPRAARAVGGASNRNQISIIIPCHRVIGSDGSLTGYAGGLWRKKWLLEHEKKHVEGWQPGRDEYYWVYMLLLDNGSLYTGYTSNLVRRYSQHKTGQGGARLTRGFLPREIIACWRIFGTRSVTMRVEYYIKQQDRKTKEKLIAEPKLLKEYLQRDLGLHLKIFSFQPEIIHAFLARWEDEDLYNMEEDPFSTWPQKEYL